MCSTLPSSAARRVSLLFSMLLFAVLATTVQAQPQVLNIVLAGQSTIRSDLRVTAPAELPVMRSLLAGGDVVFTNLEATVAEPGQSVRHGSAFLAPPEALDVLQGEGFNLLALADNHSYDLGVVGLDNTLREADRRHLVHAGTGDDLQQAAAPAYLHTAHGTVALIASASGALSPDADATAQHPGLNELHVEAGGRANEGTADLPGNAQNEPDMNDAARILRSIREARQHADVVIVYQHNHVFGLQSFQTIFSEGMAQRLAPNPWLKRWAHAQIDAGADIVVMHGAPLLHGIEIYHGRPIFYDLGNFIYNLSPTATFIEEPMVWESVVAHVRFEHGALRSIDLQPITLNAIGEGQPDVHDRYVNNRFLDTRGLPAPASGSKGFYILQRLAALSRPFGTMLRVEGDSAHVQLPRR